MAGIGVHDPTMTNWNDVLTATPELARLVQERFEATGLGYLATIRRDGSPRISGNEPLFHGGEVWLGMMWESRKALDLRRDARMALHSASIDKDVTEGDARISGRAVEHTSEDEIARARIMFADANGQAPPPGPMHLFSLDIDELVVVRPENDRLVVRSWTSTGGNRRHERT
jgi:hypothetical protein